MTPEEAAALRAEFKPEQIGKLPKVNCRACTEANKREFGTTCAKHRKSECPVCKNWITSAHIHLDYVGHAATTDRLLQVDPGWTWEFVPDYPMTSAGLWIKLTVAGVSRYGFGDGKSPKEMIGDAIRNAAMRFGVALDLWAKEDLRSDESSGPVETATSVPPADAPGPEPSAQHAASKERIAEIITRVDKLNLGDWVKDQHFAWPWDDDVVDVIEARCNLTVSAA